MNMYSLLQQNWELENDIIMQITKTFLARFKCATILIL